MRRLLAMLTPWWSEADALQREVRSEEIRRRSFMARNRAEQVIRNYREADERLGRMSGR